MPDTSIGGHKYFLTIIDDYSKRVGFISMSNKSNVFEKVKEYITLAENQTGKSLKAMRSGNGTEFANRKFNIFCSAKGIVQQKSVSHTPQQTGVAHRYNRTILEKIRTLKIDSELPKKKLKRGWKYGRTT